MKEVQGFFEVDMEEIEGNGRENKELEIMEDLQNIRSQAIRKIEFELNEIYSVWNEIGLDSDQQKARGDTAFFHIYKLIIDIKKEEIAACEHVKDQIRSLTDEISILSSALSIEFSEVTGCTYLERLKVLEQTSNKLKVLKEQRLKELKDLRIVEQNYCELLGMGEYTTTAEVPSEADLKGLQQHICTLTSEYTKRYETYLQAKQQLSTILEVTETTPETTLEKHICSDKEPFSLSKSTFQEIEEIIARARKRKEELENKKKVLIDRLKLLWDRLNIDDSFRVEFMSKHVDCKASTLKAIQVEVEKYEEMKKQNLNLFIDSVRKELEELWKKCGASDLEQKIFNPYFSTDVTESILRIHEEEVEMWKKYYDKVRLILEKIEKRNKMWESLKALDNKANDPERYKNRGGYLLKEEKERNNLVRTLPTLEQDITEAIEKYENEARQKFFYLGEDYRIVMDNQWSERSSKKENVKQDKYSTPAKRTPKKSPKLKLATYRTRMTPITRMTPKSVKKTIKKRELGVLKEVCSNLNEYPTCSNATSYPDFEMELNRTGRKSLRSSAVASNNIGKTRTLMPLQKQNIANRRSSIN